MTYREEIRMFDKRIDKLYDKEYPKLTGHRKIKITFPDYWWPAVRLKYLLGMVTKQPAWMKANDWPSYILNLTEEQLLTKMRNECKRLENIINKHD